MDEFGWPLPPAGSVDKKKCDELVSLAKIQWTVFLGISSERPMREGKTLSWGAGRWSYHEYKKEWVVVNMTTGEIVFRGEARRIIDTGRTAIIRVADGGCVIRHVHDKHFLLDEPSDCDIPLAFPEARIHTASYVYPVDGIIMRQISGGYVLCTVLSGHKNPEQQKLAGRIAIWSVRSSGVFGSKIIGYIPAVTRADYFAPGKILIKRSSSSPEIWRIEPKLEFESLLVEDDIANINTCSNKNGVHYYPSKNGHLALWCCNELKIIKSGERKISHTLKHYDVIDWLGAKHLAAYYMPPFDGPKKEKSTQEKLINIETGEEKIIPGDYFKLPGQSDSFAIVKDNFVEIWQLDDFWSADAEPREPVYVFNHPPGVKIEKYNGSQVSYDGLDMVTFASDDIFRLWRKGKLIGEHHYPIWRDDRRSEILWVSILDPEMDWVEALGKWLLYSLHGKSVSMHLEIIALVLVYLI